jgi:hypothetical protein
MSDDGVGVLDQGISAKPTRSSGISTRSAAAAVKRKVQNATSVVAEKADRVKNMKLQSGELGLLLYTVPEQRQRWGDTQVMPHVEWGDLFFDLFYVAAAYNLGGLLKEDPSFRGIVYFCAMFFPLIQTWQMKLQFDARFFVNDHCHRFMTMFRLCILAMLVLHIRPIRLMEDEGNSAMTSFCTALLLDWICCIIQWLEVALYAKGGPEARRCGWSFVQRSVPVFGYYLAAVAVAASRYTSAQHSSESSHDTGSHDTGSHRMLGGDSTAGTVHDTHAGGSTGGSTYSLQLFLRDLPVWVCLSSYVWSWVWMVFSIGFHSSCKVGPCKDSRLRPPPDGFKAGDNVEALKGQPAGDKAAKALGDGLYDEGGWVAGTVKAVVGDGLYEVQYTDGSTQEVAEALISPVNTIRSRQVPMNINFSLHRWGEWIMLMLGESVLSLLIVTVKVQSINSILYSLLIVFSSSLSRYSLLIAYCTVY